jgi:hypothetical protein
MASKKYTWVAAIALTITCGGTCTAHADPDKVAYELAERCGKRAKMMLEKNEGGVISTYESHYNAKLNSCFAVTNDWHSSSGLEIKIWEIWDVNENRRLAYASCTRVLVGDKCATADIQTPVADDPASATAFRAALQRYMER